MAVPVEHVHRLTVGEYLVLVDRAAGAWERTELVEGVVYDLSPESSVHAHAVMAVLRGLEDAIDRERVMAAGSVEVASGSLWSPDVYVLRPGAGEPAAGRPYSRATDVELVVEVAVSSLARDRSAKYRGYAEAGVPEYWIVVPETGGHVECHRHPAGDRYLRVDRFELPGGHADLDVAALLV